jgi:hypothetical protein
MDFINFYFHKGAVEELVQFVDKMWGRVYNVSLVLRNERGSAKPTASVGSNVGRSLPELPKDWTADDPVLPPTRG